jgi:hypothetical protein
MVCFVHDRQFLSKFHAAINQLRQTNEFTVFTLRQLPKRCCSCPEKRNNMTSTAAQPQLTSENIDAIRLFCVQFELQQYAGTNALSEPSKILHYTVLPFPVLVNAKEQENITDQFIFQQQSELYTLEKMHHVCLEFVTSATPKELLKEVVDIQRNLVAKCSDSVEAIEAINGLWVIISGEDQSRVDLVKHVLQQQWTRFITSIDMYQNSATYNGLQNLPPKVTNKKNSNRQRAEIKRQKMLKKRTAKQQVILGNRVTVRRTW